MSPAMPPPPPPRSPIERILGPGLEDAGPFALLGIPPENATAQMVRAALDQRMAQVGAHPEANTPAGEEVRLAIHVAAASLLNPQTRGQLERARMAASISRSVGRVAPAAQAVQDQVANDVIREVEQEALIAMALHGGWNRRALRHLVIVAHSKGISSAMIARSIRELATSQASKGPSPQASQQTAQAGSAPTAPNQTSTEHAPAVWNPAPAPVYARQAPDPVGRAIIIIGGVASALLIMIALTIYISTRSPTLGTPIPAPPGPQATATRGGPTPQGQQTQDSSASDDGTNTTIPAIVNKPRVQRRDPDVPQRNPLDHRVAQQQLVEAKNGLAFDASKATTDFEAVYRSVASNWGSYSPSQITALQGGIVDFVYGAGAAGQGDRVLEIIGAGAQQLRAVRVSEVDASEILPVVWSAGMLSRLLSERDLSAQFKRDLEARCSRIFEGSIPARFEAGATHALKRLVPILASSSNDPVQVPLAEARARWSEWTLAASTVGGSDPQRVDPLVLSALETLLIEPGKPELSPDRRAALRVLIPQLDWRETGTARRWLVTLFDNQQVTADGLSAVTEALAVASSAQGVDLTMVLSANASELARRDLRDRYAKAWNLPDAGSANESMTRLAIELKRLEDLPAPKGAIERLALGTKLARLHEAATLLWDGRTSESSQLLDTLDDPVNLAMEQASQRRAGSRPERQDAPWAEAYLIAQNNTPKRLELIEQKMRSSNLHTVDAEVLVEEAVRGTPTAVREAASDAVMHFSTRTAIVNALLEELPSAPRIRRFARLVEFCSLKSLPDVRDPDWRLESRKALVERLLQLTSGESEFAVIDTLSGIITEAYMTSLAQRSSPVDVNVSTAARLLAERWQAASARTPLLEYAPNEVKRRRLARLAVARGVTQNFEVEQIALAESLAAAIASEQPARASDVSDIMSLLRAHRRETSDVFGQITITEHAIIRLWLVRYRVEQR